MKIALLNDTHFGARNDSPAFLDYFMRFYDEIFFPYLQEHNIKTLIHLGDVVDRRKFINFKTAHTFRDDMISDGIENCLQYLDNFNPAKSNNPFAYFTQIIYYAFVRRIQKEKKQVTIKHKLIMDSNYDDVALQPGEDKEFKNQFREFLQKNLKMEDQPKVEKKKKKTRVRKPTSKLFH